MCEADDAAAAAGEAGGGCASPLLPKARIEGFVIDRGLANLYDAMETGEFGSGELAPRTRSLFQEREDLARTIAESQGALNQHAIPL